MEMLNHQNSVTENLLLMSSETSRQPTGNSNQQPETVAGAIAGVPGTRVSSGGDESGCSDSRSLDSLSFPIDSCGGSRGSGGAASCDTAHVSNTHTPTCPNGERSPRTSQSERRADGNDNDTCGDSVIDVASADSSREAQTLHPSTRLANSSSYFRCAHKSSARRSPELIAEIRATRCRRKLLS